MTRSGNLALLSRNFPKPLRTYSYRSVDGRGIPDLISRNRIIYRTMATVLGRVIVYGGKGALGSACVSQFKSQNWVSNGVRESRYPRIQYNTINRAVFIDLPVLSIYCIKFDYKIVTLCYLVFRDISLNDVI